jgi:hypothetical protein
LSSLDNKKINIDGKQFTVSKHLVNMDGNIETVILTREIHSRKKGATYLEDIGLKKIVDLDMSEEQYQAQMDLFTDSIRSRGILTMVGAHDDGELFNLKFKAFGRDTEDDQNLLIQIEATREIISIDEMEVICGMRLFYILPRINKSTDNSHQNKSRLGEDIFKDIITTLYKGH